MNRNSESIARRARQGQRGQMLTMVAVSLVGLLGLAGMAIDVGQVYYSYTELQASTDAAAIAGAQSLPDTTAAADATAFSGVPGSKNARSNLPNVQMVSGYPLVRCLTTLTDEGTPCVAPASANAIVVKQQVTVPTTFMKLFGASSFTLTATATAAMRGSARVPYNVALVMDTTASMAGARIRNAMNGAQVLLASLSPCAASASSCGSVTPNGSGGDVANPVDRVALYAYPPVTKATAANDYNCPPLNQPATVAYATPFPSTSTYQIVNFSSDYRTSDSVASLNSSSNLVGAVGATSSTGCLQAKGGYGTYFAQAIHVAQADLALTALPNVQNVIIVLSDGDANATSADVPGASSTDECRQAVNEAVTATNAGTRVYTVAYGASNSGCSTDASPYNNPCYTLQQMASDASTFFKDNSSSCSSGARPTTDLNTIFTQIAGDLTVARLIPNGTP